MKPKDNETLLPFAKRTCDWSDGWNVAEWSGDCGAYSHEEPWGGWKYCPFCGRPIRVTEKKTDDD